MKGAGAGSGAERDRWARRAQWLVGGTVAYNAIEAGIALAAGISARSIALVGFGLDSIIELAAAAVVLWRVRVETRGGAAAAVARAEDRVRRFVGVTFFLLAAYVTVQASAMLWRRAPPEESLPGIVLAAVSLAVMPLLSWGKLRAADALGSRALRAEAMETLACAYLSFTLLVGLGANALFGLWWADPAAALLMVPWLIHEGIESFEDEDEG